MTVSLMICQLGGVRDAQTLLFPKLLGFLVVLITLYTLKDNILPDNGRDLLYLELKTVQTQTANFKVASKLHSTIVS